MITRNWIVITLLIGFLSARSFAGNEDLLHQMLRSGLASTGAYKMLSELAAIGGRPAGSPQYNAAAEWAQKTMTRLSLENVRQQSVTVRRWIRGTRQEATLKAGGKQIPLPIVALGGSTATPPSGLEAEVVEVKSVDEMLKLGDPVKGKIVFFNGPMDPSFINTFEAYSIAADQRYRGPGEASKLGAVGAIVRSMTLTQDDIPHTGATSFKDRTPIPAAAVSTNAADLLSASLKKDPRVRVKLHLSASMNGEAPAANVIGEIRGSEKPGEIILIGAHLDSWDAGQGAHDDGSGCAHVLEAMNLLRSLGVKPKRTIRAVLFANEEFGSEGAKGYADSVTADELHIAAIESDAGGFTPRGFAIQANGETLQRILAFAPRFRELGAWDFVEGESGVDIEHLVKKGAAGVGFRPDSQRYFDYHHSARDTLDKVNPRELELGSISVAYMAYLLSEEL